ncbi:MAG: ShlB/FhaC/HecB family hemolysin secretion/activation protein [Alphaproteobacteria bacterium]
MTKLNKWNVAVMSVTIVALNAVAPSLAHAAPPPGVVDEAGRISQQEQRRDEERRARESQKRLRTFDSEGKQLPNQDVSVKPMACLQVNEIRFEGATHLLPNEKKRVFAGKYVGKCIGNKEISDILQQATGYFIDQGAITTRVVLPEQNIASGVLRIAIIEGNLNKIDLKGSDARQINLATAFPGLEGQQLNLRDLEQGLDQINRLRSNNAKLDLVPGKGLGDTDVVITNTKTQPFHLDVRVDNSGSESTGETLAEAKVYIDNVLGLNDEIGLSYRSNFEPQNDQKKSLNYSASISIPYGYWLASAQFGKSEYAFRIDVPGDFFISTGETEFWNIALDRVMYRDQTTRVNASAGLTVQDSENFVDGSKIAVSSRKSSVANATLRAVRYLPNGQITADLSYVRGLDAFGATGRLPGGPQPFFSKTTGGASYKRWFDAGRHSVSFQSALRGQVGHSNLFGKDQMSTSGRYGVRGFDDATVSGDTTAYLRNDLAMELPVNGIAGYKAAFAPYIFADGGRVWNDGTAGSQSVFGAGGGVRAQVGPLQFDAAIARALKGLSTVNVPGDDGRHFYFMAATSF